MGKLKLPPVSFPFSLQNCIRAFISSDAPDQLMVNSGRAALQIGLFALERGGDVILPDFVCPSVSLSIRQAGMIPKIVPLEPKTWRYQPDALAEAIQQKPAAVITVSYFGLPAPAIDIPHGQDTLIIADLAQAYGMSETAIRTISPDIWIYSFGLGKSLPSASGGLVCGTSEFKDRITRLITKSASSGPLDGLKWITKTMLYGFLTQPKIWKHLPNNLVAKDEPEIFEQFLVKQSPKISKRYINRAHHRLQNEIDQRRINAITLASDLRHKGPWSMPSDAELMAGVALRFPIVFNTSYMASLVKERLKTDNIIHGRYSYDSWGSSDNSSDISSRVLSLPVFSGSERAAPSIIKTILSFETR